MKNQTSIKRWALIALLAILLLLLFLVYWPFKQSSSGSAQIIPNDVALVCAIDMPQILREANFVEIQKSSSFKSYINQASLENPIFAEILRNPIGSGIALDEDLFFVYDKDTTLQNKDFSVIIFPLNDRSEFEELVKGNKSKSRNIENATGFKYYEIDRLTAIAWDDNNAILGSTNSFISIKEKFDRFFSTSVERSILQDEKFNKALNENSDLAIWISSNAFVSDKEALKTFSLQNIEPAILANNYVIATINFDIGEITGDVEFEFKNELRESFNTFFQESNETEIFNYFPAQDLSVIAFTSLNLPNIYFNLIEDSKTRGQIDKYLAKQNLSTNDIMRMLTGDIAFATYHEKESKDTKLAVGMKLDNSAMLNKILRIGMDGGYVSALDDNIFLLSSKKKNNGDNESKSAINTVDMLIMRNDEYVFITTSKNFLEQFRKGMVDRFDRINQELLDEFDNHLLAGYSDLTNMEENEQGRLEMESVNFSLSKQKLSFILSLKNKSAYSLQEIFASP